MKKKYDLAIIAPTYNNNLNDIKDFRLFLKDFQKANLKKCFILFVDDSIDNRSTLEIRNNIKSDYNIIRGPKQKNGRFAALFVGFKWILKNIQTDIFVELDTDASHRFKDFNKGYKEIQNNNDLVNGSKYLKESVVKGRTLDRVFFSTSVSLFCKFLFSNKISDFTNGYRFYNKKIIKKILNNPMVFDSPCESLNIVLFAILIKAKIKEFPTKYIGNDISHWSNNYFYVFLNFFKTFYIIFVYLMKIYIFRK
jgi:dolichol-phosphate mannosyltransferase